MSSISTQVILEAVPYTELARSCTMFNRSVADDCVMIHIPEPIARYLSLESIKNMITDEYVDLDLDNCIRESFHPWYSIDSSKLDLTVGFHEYRMRFLSFRLQDIIDLFFKYQVYDDKLDKPYIYMKNEEI